MPLTKVTSGVIAANAVVDSFGTQSITGDKIGLNAITGNTLASNIINSNNIVTGAVTGDKLGATSINANNIVNATITGAKLASTTITGDKITVGSLAGNVFTANTITGDKIGQNAVSSNNIIASVTLTTPQLSGNLVSSTNSSIRFVSTNAYDGQQNSKIQWINENQNGVMAQISGIREQNAGAPGALGFYTNSNVDSGGYTPTERMRVDSSGRILIGTTATSPATADAYGVTIGSAGGGSAYAGVIQASSNGSRALLLNRGSDNGETAGFYRSAVQVGSISVTGSATAFNTSSDYRLKENIAPMTGALFKVTQLKPCTYIWKSTGENGEGFIAHELQAIVPDAVTGEKDAVDTEGNPIYQGVDTSFLVATLTAAIQELKTELDAAKQRITELENANK